MSARLQAPLSSRRIDLAAVSYGMFLAGALAAAIWMRFTSSGLRTVFGYIATTRSSGGEENLLPMQAIVLTIIPVGLVLLGIVSVRARRRREDVSPVEVSIVMWGVIASGILAAVVAHTFG